MIRLHQLTKRYDKFTAVDGIDLAGAQAALQRALELDPRDSKTPHLLGRVFDRLGQPDEARDMYERSRELAGG